MKKRDIGQEILDGIKDIKKGRGNKFMVEVPSDVKKIRDNLNLSQSAFAAIMGISIRTLQDWEQGRRKPSGPAMALLRIASIHPEAFRAA
ncbi:MAG: helix-turn-helix domain-containing protein [Nitrospirae bacterium]|nr:helix-turn-helix domain-containing protein [Nitrospirota bacterium]